MAALASEIRPNWLERVLTSLLSVLYYMAMERYIEKELVRLIKGQKYK